MLNKKILFFSSILTIAMVFVACSSQEYTTAKLAIQQSEFTKAAEWLPKAMAVEPDNPEIPVVMAVEIHAENGKWQDMVNLFNKAMDINPDKVIELRGSFIPVKEAVGNYIDFYWAKEFNSGVEQFKKIQDDPENKPEYLETAILHFSNAAIINPSDANTHATLAKCYFDKGDKYPCHCCRTTYLLASKLSLNAENYKMTFQSRLGVGEWMKDYTDETLKSLPSKGIKNVQVICPGFSADCLETIEEINEENKKFFMEAGGESFKYIPALNDRKDHINCLIQLIQNKASDWLN